jgi:hypothetical protein
MNKEINIIPSQKLDKEKWDRCIGQSGNDIIYAHSWYLDHMAANWHGIVVGDYECVMPVAWKKKAGIRYCYDVPFVQQLGYFTNRKCDEQELIKTLLDLTPYGYYNFNSLNQKVSDSPGVTRRTNLVLDLSNYETVHHNFKKPFLQSLQHASRSALSYLPATAGEAIQIFKKLYGKEMTALSSVDYKNLLSLADFLSPLDKCIARKVTDENGQVLSIVLLTFHGKKLYNIINATSGDGREKESNYFLYSSLFSEFSGKGLTFDFEGSEFPGIKSFYKKTGAVEEYYYRMRINKLPFPLKLITSVIKGKQ